MLPFFAQIVFGWPFIILSLLLAAAGIILKRPAIVTVGAVLFTPPALYLSGYPSLRLFALLLPLSILGAAYFVSRGKAGIAWALLSPPIVLSAWLAFIVLNQNRILSGG